MRKSVILCTTAVVALLATDARAQWAEPLEGRLVVSVNGGGQAGSTDIDRLTTFELYGEQAQIASSQEVSAGGVFDLGAAYRLGPNWGVGLAYSASGSSNSGAISGSLPHPVFTNQPRTFSTSVPGLDTRERAVHLQAVLFIPWIEDVDFTVAAGPSFFSARQGFSRDVSFIEVPPAYNAVNINGVSVVDVRESGTGFNISGDMSYRITRAIGAGLLLRYSRASFDVNLGDGASVELRPGGFQAAAGLRLRF